LIDSSSDQDQASEILKAQVIVLVYDVNTYEIKKRIKNYWLPLIQKVSSDVPIILCGNKIDLRSSSHEDLESTVTSAFTDFR